MLLLQKTYKISNKQNQLKELKMSSFLSKTPTELKEVNMSILNKEEEVFVIKKQMQALQFFLQLKNKLLKLVIDRITTAHL